MNNIENLKHLIIYQSQNNENISVEVLYNEEDFWLTQKSMGKLFNVETNTINYHLKEIFESHELDENGTIRKIRTVQNEGSRSVSRELTFYSLEAIIAVGYRVNSKEATDFRIWATKTLKEYIKKGFVINSEFLKNVQNKLHYAITGMTAPEIIYSRVNSKKENMGLTMWKNAPDGKILETDVTIAKNYLSQEEITELNNLVSMYLDYAERQVKLNKIISMKEWKDKLEVFLKVNEYNILQDNGKIKREIADKLALDEYEKYRVIQDNKYISDFDKLLIETKNLRDN